MKRQQIIILFSVALLFLTLQYLLNVTGQLVTHYGAVNSLIVQAGLIIFALALIFLAYKRGGAYRKWLIGFACLSMLTAFFFISYNGISSERRLVGAYYYVWYEEWWQTAYQDEASKTPYPDEPLLGRYLSNNESVIEQHLKWARDYSIDFFAISLWGDSHEPWSLCSLRTYENAQLVFSKNRELGYPLKLCVMIEPRSTAELSALTDKAFALASDSCYLEWYGKPLLFVYTEYIGKFASFNDARFTIKYVPTDVPYFINEVQTTFVGDAISVKPGINIDYAYVPRNNGEYYKSQWQFAVNWARLNPQRSLMVLITSFNENFECSMVEPCSNWVDPYLYLKITKEYSTQFRQT